MQITNCYLIFKNDFKQRKWWDWIIAHVMGAPPPYRFKGMVTFDRNYLNFSGYDAYLKENTAFSINKIVFTQLYYGYDKTFSRAETRGMGIFWAPIRFTLDDPKFEDETTLYLVSEYNGMVSTNKTLFEELKHWLT